MDDWLDYTHSDQTLEPIENLANACVASMHLNLRARLYFPQEVLSLLDSLAEGFGLLYPFGGEPGKNDHHSLPSY